jgi:hypothetical protein
MVATAHQQTHAPLVLVKDVDKRLSLGVAYAEAPRGFIDVPEQREAARRLCRSRITKGSLVWSVIRGLSEFEGANIVG